MRLPIPMWLGLIVLNGGLWLESRSASMERMQVEARLAASTRRVDAARSASGERARLGALIALARVESSLEPLGISPLRDLLIAAEDGLPVARVGLDFRPLSDVPADLDGSRITASLTGPIDGLFAYLERVDALKLPMTTESLSIRGDGQLLTLAIRWLALWPRHGETDPGGLSDSEMNHLAAWLNRSRPAPLGRDLFAFASEPTVPLAGMATTPEQAPEGRSLDPAGFEDSMPELPEAPELTGFVLARPELEEDVRRRVLAAMRYDGAVRLVKVGDRIGRYVVEHIEARESVTLSDRATGERLLLRLE